MSEFVDWEILGSDSIGIVAVGPDGFRFYLTPCCKAATTRTASGVACAVCYQEVAPELGGEAPLPPSRPFLAGTKRVSDGHGCTERVPSWMDDPYGYDGNQ